MSAQKKVVIRMADGALHWGYLPQNGFVSAANVQLLGVDGKVNLLDLNAIKTIAYVKEFNLEDAADPERIGRRSFLGRPRSEGLWLKVDFRDGDALEGLAHFDLGFVDLLTEDRVIAMAPPEARSNTQRVMVPRVAVASLEVLGFVGAPAKRKAMERAVDSGQRGLFGE